MKYKVIHDGGFSFQGARRSKGDSFEFAGRNAEITAGLHFRQIEEVKAEAEEPAGGAGNGPQASEAAKALAAEKGIDLSTVTGSGANGSITKPDVEAAIEAAKTAGGAGN